VESAPVGNIALKLLKKTEVKAFGLIFITCVTESDYNRRLCSRFASANVQAGYLQTNILLCHYIISLLFLLLNVAWEWKESADLPQQLSKSF
jgi:NADH:ubiquinone oxidoreductase subunit 3 (subunit A)